MFFISFGRKKRPGNNKTRKPEKKPADKMMAKVDVELDKIAVEVKRSGPGINTLLKETTELGLALGDAPVENVKKLSGQQKVTYGEWVEHRLRWFKAMKSVAGYPPNTPVHKKLNLEIARLKAIQKNL